MEDSFDIYADLDNLDVDQVNSDSENEDKIRKQCEDRCKTLEAEIAELKAQIQNLMRINNNFEQNFSSLLKTAKAEISRKDRQITDLRSKYDTLTFRRDQRHRGRAHNYPPASNTKSFSIKNHHEIADNKQDAHIQPLLELPYSEAPQPQLDEYTAYNNTNDTSVAYSKQNYLQRPSSDESEDEAKTDGTEFKKTLFGERLRNRLMEEKEAERRQKEEKEREIQNKSVAEEPKIKVEDSKPEVAPLNTSSDKENKVDTNKLSQATHKAIDPRVVSNPLHKPTNHCHDEVKVENEVKCSSEGSQEDVKVEDRDTYSSSEKNDPHNKKGNSQSHPLRKNVKDECSANNSHVVSDHNYNRDLGGQNSDKDEYVPLPLRNLRGQEHLHHTNYNGQSRYNNSERSNGNVRRTRRDEYDERHRRNDRPRSSDDHRGRQDERSRSKHWREENDRSSGRSRSKRRMRENDRYRTERSRSRHSREDSNHHSKERGRSRYRTDENDPRSRSKSRHQRGEDLNRPKRRSRSRHQITETNNRRKDRSSSRHRIKETSSSEKDVNEKNRSSKDETKKDNKTEHKQDHQSKEKCTIRHSSKENDSTERESSEKDYSSGKETKKLVEKNPSRRSSKDTESLEKNVIEKKLSSERDAKERKTSDCKRDNHSEGRSSSRHSSKETDTSEKDVNEKKRLSVEEAKKLKGKEDHRSKERSSSRRSSKDTNTCEKEINKKNCPSEETKKHKNSEHKSNRTPKKMRPDKDSKKCKTPENRNKKKKQDDKVKTPKRKRRSNSEEKRCDPLKRQKICSDDQINAQENNRIPQKESESKLSESRKDPACDLSTDLRSDETDSTKLEMERLRILRLLEADDEIPENQNLEANQMIQETESVSVKDDNKAPCDPAIKKEKTKINMTEYLLRKKVTLSSKETTNSDDDADDLAQNVCKDDGQSEILENGSILKTILLSTKSTIDNIKHTDVATESPKHTRVEQDGVEEGEVEEGEILDSPKPKTKPNSSHINVVSGKSVLETETKEDPQNKIEIEKSKNDIKRTGKKVPKGNREDVKQNLVQQDFQDSIHKLKASRSDEKVERKVRDGNFSDMDQQIIIEKESQGEAKKFEKEDNVDHKRKRSSGNDASLTPVVTEDSRRRTRTDEKKEHTNEAENASLRTSKRTHGTMKTRQKTQKALHDFQESKTREDEIVETIPAKRSSSDRNSVVKQEFQNAQEKQTVDEISEPVPEKEPVSDQTKISGQDPLIKKKGIEKNRIVEDAAPKAPKAPQNSVTVSSPVKKPPPLDIKGVKNIVFVNRNRRRSRILGNSEDKVVVNRSIENENTSSPVHKSNDNLNASFSPQNRSLKIQSPRKSPQNLRKLTKLENNSEAKAQTTSCSKDELPGQKLTSKAAEVTIEDKIEVINPNSKEKTNESLSKKSVKPVVSSQNSPKCKPVSAKPINIAKPLVGNIIICNRPRRRPQLSDSR